MVVTRSSQLTPGLLPKLYFHGRPHSPTKFDSILEAAMTAAYYSRGRGSSRIAVDYTPVKNLHKPKGARPGFVTFSHQKTVFVSPDKVKVEKLLVA